MHQSHSYLYPLSQSQQPLQSMFVMPILQMTRLRLGEILHGAQSRDLDLGSEAPVCSVS